MTALLDLVAVAGTRLARASNGKVSVDARRALSRTDDLKLGPAGQWSPNGHCRLIECSDGWIALSLAREDDRDMIPAWTGASFSDDPWDAVTQAARLHTQAQMASTGASLHLPVAIVGEATSLASPSLRHSDVGDGLILDLSALWAGPYCGALLAEAGHSVIKLESPSRPDPTAAHTPQLDARLNGAKRRLQLSLDDPDLFSMIATARVMITSARPHALARLGISEEHVFTINPNLLWIAITAHGWTGDAAMRVGFGDDCAAAGGLVHWVDGMPRFMGDALADPLTGMTAATLAFDALAAGQCGLLDMSLARTAACFAEDLA